LISADDEDFDAEICTIKVGGGGKFEVTNTKFEARAPSWGSHPYGLFARIAARARRESGLARGERP
jgi:hypothetical protein